MSAVFYLHRPLSIDEIDAKYSTDYTLQTLICSINCRLIKQKATNNTIMVVQVKGSIQLLNNMLCSLQRINTQLEKRILVWAYDIETYTRLSKIDSRQYELIFDSEVESFGPPDKEHMMKYRPRFFLKIVKLLKLNLFFVDADIVFHRDPWPWVVSNSGLGIDTYTDGPRIDPNSLLHLKHAHKKLEVLNQIALQSEPDIVYSSDARRFYYQLQDPFESGNIVPQVCGGLFLFRSTPQTIAFLQALRYFVEKDYNNDQGSANDILNWRVSRVILVGKLPRCLPRWPGMDPEFCDKETLFNLNFKMFPQWIQKYLKSEASLIWKDVLKVRILDQIQFTNGAILKQKFIQGKFPSAIQYKNILRLNNSNENLVDHRSLAPAKVAVAYHGNYEIEFPKIPELKKLGFYLIDSDNQCLQPTQYIND